MLKSLLDGDRGIDPVWVRQALWILLGLVVAWLAKASPDELANVYESGGWRGTPDLRGLQMAARMWYAANCPERVIRGDSG